MIAEENTGIIVTNVDQIQDLLHFKNHREKM
jgi:hypothetical protein